MLGCTIGLTIKNDRILAMCASPALPKTHFTNYLCLGRFDQRQVIT